MADMLKITTPLVPSSQQVHGARPTQESDAIFNLQDITRIHQTNPQGEPGAQHNTLEQEDMPTILSNLLKDPSVTVTYLKNIFMLQDIVGLLSVNNQTVTRELEELFDALLLKPEDIVPELMSQGKDSTIFSGKLFDSLLRLIGEASRGGADIRGDVVGLLKSLSSTLARRDILDAVSNNLTFMAQGLAPSRSLSDKLTELARLFKSPGAPGNFSDLKNQTLALLREVEGSILFSPGLAKVVSIVTYNLSRFSDNPDLIQEAMNGLLETLPGKEQKQEVVNGLREFIESFGELYQDEAGLEKLPLRFNYDDRQQRRDFFDYLRHLMTEQSRGEQRTQSSKVMDTLVKIISRQSEEENAALLSSGKLEKILQSLLSSPCNFTPMLHFIVPVEYEDVKSFAEMWINPNGDEDSAAEGNPPDKSIHMLIVFDIGEVGRFETELYVRGEVIDLSLLCPPTYASLLSGIETNLSRSISGLHYKFGKIRISPLERPRSLIEVFKSLPNRRVGVDVKI